jgi:hypothetical protein
VDALEEVGIARVLLDLRLGRRARQRQRRGHLRRAVLEADESPDLPEALQLPRLEVEHRHAVAVDARGDVDHDVGVGRGVGLHGGQPAPRLLLVHLDAEPPGRVDQPLDRIGLCVVGPFERGLVAHPPPPSVVVRRRQTNGGA